ncbi:hypothetical protein ACFYM2_21425 [Streptomyces sp. NPDC006711]|uniref:hypothetical protein n=1 Tax=Streptomyces sp. NPDC006711 TaxID=3364762 RepID=UPI0036963535
MTDIGIPPRSPQDWDVPLPRLAADVKALALRQQAVALEQLAAETSANAHAAVPVPDGRLIECLHQFLDIDPDLRVRDYSNSFRTRGGAS